MSGCYILLIHHKYNRWWWRDKESDKGTNRRTNCFVGSTTWSSFSLLIWNGISQHNFALLLLSSIRPTRCCCCCCSAVAALCSWWLELLLLHGLFECVVLCSADVTVADVQSTCPYNLCTVCTNSNTDMRNIVAPDQWAAQWGVGEEDIWTGVAHNDVLPRWNKMTVSLISSLIKLTLFIAFDTHRGVRNSNRGKFSCEKWEENVKSWKKLERVEKM